MAEVTNRTAGYTSLGLASGAATLVFDNVVRVIEQQRVMDSSHLGRPIYTDALRVRNKALAFGAIAGLLTYALGLYGYQLLTGKLEIVKKD